MATRATRKTAVRSVYRTEQQVVIEVLRSLRESAGLTQVGLAEALGRTQSYVSAAERGSKLDTLQIRDWCHACGTDLVTWARAIETALSGKRR